MSKYLILFTAIIFCSCNNQQNNDVQHAPKEIAQLSISPSVDTSKVLNREVIAVLKQFLKTKNQSALENEYWIDADFDKYIYPYFDIFNIEKGKHGDNHFQPTLMELIDLPENEKLAKLGFVGIHPDSSEPVIRCIYNVIVVDTGGEWKLKRAMDYNTRNWHKLEAKSITYHLPEYKEPNMGEVTKQENEVELLCNFFETEPIHIDYYSCDSPKQVFEIRGFDYFPNMYFGDRGGQAGYADIIYSGNNSEIYTHEIAHIYTKNLFPRCNRLLDEGVATLLGGSVGYDYAWHKAKMADFVRKNKIDLRDYLDPYQREYIDDETPIPYMVGALICERTIRTHGKQALFNLFASEDAFWQMLEPTGITAQNLNKVLKAELNRPPISLAF